MLLCPNCGARGIGKVGTGQYYCWECCVEFRAGKKGWQVYEVQDDGSLVTLDGAQAAVAAGFTAGESDRIECGGQ